MNQKQTNQVRQIFFKQVKIQRKWYLVGKDFRYFNLQEVIILIIQDRIVLYQERMASKNKEQIFIKILKAVQNQDISKLQGYTNKIEWQQREVINAIKNNVKKSFQDKKKIKSLENQLKQAQSKQQKYFVQYEKLKHSKLQYPHKNQKIQHQCYRVFEYFKQDRLQEAKQIICNNDIKKMLLDLSQYRQLKLEFCRKENHQRNYEQCSKYYTQLRLKLLDQKAAVGQVHDLYERFLQKIVNNDQLDLNIQKDFPQSVKEKLQLFSVKLISLRTNLRNFAQRFQEFPEHTGEQLPEKYSKQLRNCSKIYQQVILEEYKDDPNRKNINLDQRLLKNIRDKLDMIEQTIDSKFMDKVKLMKMATEQTENQIKILQKVISVLNNNQFSQIKRIKYKEKNIENLSKEEQENLKVGTTLSLEQRVAYLEKLQSQLKAYLENQIKSILDCEIQNPLQLSSLQENHQTTDETLKINLETNLLQLVKEYKQLKVYKQDIQKKEFLRKNMAYSEGYLPFNKSHDNSGQILDDNEFIEDLNLQIEGLNKKLAQKQRSLIQYQKLIKQLRNQIGQSKNELSRLKLGLDKQVGRIKLMQHENRELGKSLIRFSTINPQGLQNQQPQIFKLQQHYNKLNADLKQKDKQIQFKDRKISEFTNQVAQTKRQIGLFVNQDAKLRKKIEILLKQQAASKQKIAKQNNQINQHLTEIQRLNQSYREALNSNELEYCKYCKQNNKLQLSVEKLDIQNIKSENFNHLNRQGEEANFSQKQTFKNQLRQTALLLNQQILRNQQSQNNIKAITNQKQKLNRQLEKAEQMIQQLQKNKNKIEQSELKLTQINHLLKLQVQEKKNQVVSLKSQIDNNKQIIAGLRQKLEQKQNLARNNQMEERDNRFTNGSAILQQTRFTEHLFTAGDIFDQYYEQQRLELISKLESNLRPIKRTKLIYKYDTINRVNFHKYIDDHKHIVLVIKTLYGKVIAGYSEQCFNSNGTKKGNAYLMALWNKKIYRILKDKKGITYDDYFLIFGNSEIRIRALQSKFFSNFGVGNSYYNNLGDKIEQFTGQKDRQVDMLTYELYELQFE